jgi:hypothetical protein
MLKLYKHSQNKETDSLKEISLNNFTLGLIKKNRLPHLVNGFFMLDTIICP